VGGGGQRSGIIARRASVPTRQRDPAAQPEKNGTWSQPPGNDVRVERVGKADMRVSKPAKGKLVSNTQVETGAHAEIYVGEASKVRAFWQESSTSEMEGSPPEVGG